MIRCEILRRAAEIVGDLDALSLLLKVPMSDLTGWLAGNANPPVHVFLSSVDIIYADADRRAGRGRGASARSAARRPSAV